MREFPKMLLAAGLIMTMAGCMPAAAPTPAVSPVNTTPASAAVPTSTAAPMNASPSGETSGEYVLERSVTVEPDGELTLKLYGKQVSQEYDYYGVRQIEVYRGDALIQTISVQEAIDAEWGGFSGGGAEYGGYSQAWDQDGGLTTGDMNFDGSGDIGLMGWITAGANVPYYYWLWDGAREQFVYAFSLCNAEADAESRQIVTQTRQDAAEYHTDYYDFDEAGNLRNVKRIVERYDGQTVVTETYELRNGQLELVS